MMTTPERLRRRQRRETAAVLFVMLLTLGNIAYNNREEAKQRDCIVENFRDLSQALEIRADLAKRETTVSKNLWLIYAEAAGLIKDDPTKPVPPKAAERLQRELVAGLITYKATIEQVEVERTANPVPPYPVGTCD